MLPLTRRMCSYLLGLPYTPNKENVVVEKARFGSPIVLYFLGAGFLIPCLIVFVMSLGAPIPGWIQIVLWPTIFLLIGGPDTSQTAAFLIATLANMIVYGLLGLVVSFCYRKFRRAGS
jgi:hypothetical protein